MSTLHQCAIHGSQRALPGAVTAPVLGSFSGKLSAIEEARGAWLPVAVWHFPVEKARQLRDELDRVIGAAAPSTG